MSQTKIDSEVLDDELLARFIFSSSHVRADLSVKPEAFMPPANLELSVVRHKDLNQYGLWQIGRSIRPEATLHGRADFQAMVARNQDLQIKLDPLPDNDAHCLVSGWPLRKPEQKIKALEIARTAQYSPNPQFVL